MWPNDSDKIDLPPHSDAPVSEHEDKPTQAEAPPPRPYTLYMDESGNRHPDKKSDQSREGRDWFAFGGVLIRGEHSDTIRLLVEGFSKKWNLKHPAHITDMLSKRKGFSWLGRRKQSEVDEFWHDWTQVLCGAPVIGIGCVVDRPGYLARGYLDRHPDRWLLCRSAFDITVERAIKIARLENRKLHVVFEQDPAFNSKVAEYHGNLKQSGLEFNASNSRKYSPLTQVEIAETLGRIQHKPKAHPLLQVADSYIYAMARQRYDRHFGLHGHMRDSKRIADHAVPAGMEGTMGVKYYCFD